MASLADLTREATLALYPDPRVELVLAPVETILELIRFVLRLSSHESTYKTYLKLVQP
jgi:hypothetical protein